MSILDTVIAEVVKEYGFSRHDSLKRKLVLALGSLTDEEYKVLSIRLEQERIKAEEEALACIKDELRWLVKNAFKPDINNHPRF